MLFFNSLEACATRDSIGDNIFASLWKRTNNDADPVPVTQNGTANPHIACNLTILHSVSEYIDVDRFVFVQNISSTPLHALLLYEKRFDLLGISE